MATAHLIAVQVRPGVVLRMTQEEADRFGYKPAANKAVKPKRTKKAAKPKAKPEEVEA